MRSDKTEIPAQALQLMNLHVISPRNLTLAPGEDGQGDPVDADVVDAPDETSPHIAIVIIVIYLGTEVDLGIGAQVQDVVEAGGRALVVN